MTMPDLFGDPERIHIQGNATLEKVCNHLLDLRRNNKDLDNGTTMKEIYSKNIIAVWKDNGLSNIIPSEYIEKFAEWMQSDNFVPADNITRGVRYLAEHDKIRIQREAILDGERMRRLITSSLNKK
jgi:hypothetical protein